MEILVKDNLQQVLHEMRHAQDLVHKANVMALNRTGKKMETEGVRLIAKVTGLRQRAVRARLKRYKAFRNRPSYVMDAYGKATNIASFSGSRQVSYKRKRVGGSRGGVRSRAWGKMRTYPRTFLIQGGRTAMKRVGKGRKPIEPVFGPSIRREFARNEKAVSRVARVYYPRYLDERLRYLMHRYQ